jgi:hypothetical protein
VKRDRAVAGAVEVEATAAVVAVAAMAEAEVAMAAVVAAADAATAANGADVKRGSPRRIFEKRLGSAQALFLMG